MSEISITHECPSCGGTGLYSGFGEGEGAAVVCHGCKGHGYRVSQFKAFEGLKPKPGVRRVYQANPGIRIGDGGGFRLENFGGIQIGEWCPGTQFPKGTEMRRFACPRWWTQSVGASMPEWDECYASLGTTFSRCPSFANKDDCWARWDAENSRKPSEK